MGLYEEEQQSQEVTGKSAHSESLINIEQFLLTLEIFDINDWGEGRPFPFQRAIELRNKRNYDILHSLALRFGIEVKDKVNCNNFNEIKGNILNKIEEVHNKRDRDMTEIETTWNPQYPPKLGLKKDLKPVDYKEDDKEEE